MPLLRCPLYCGLAERRTGLANMVRQGGARTPAFYVGSLLWAGFCGLAVMYGLGTGLEGWRTHQYVVFMRDQRQSCNCPYLAWMVVVCAVAFILSIIVSIYVFGLRDKWEGEGDSAYSLFNPGARAIPGGRSLPFSAQIFSCGRNPFNFQPTCLTALPKHANDACAYQAPRA